MVRNRYILLTLLHCFGCDEIHTKCPDSPPSSGERCKGISKCEYGTGAICCGNSYSSVDIRCDCIDGNFDCINYWGHCKHICGDQGKGSSLDLSEPDALNDYGGN